VRRRGERDVNQRTELVTIPDRDEPAQAERYGPGPDVALLTRLTAATGGRINPAVRDLVARKPGTRELLHGLDHLLVPLAMFLFLGDVAIRRMTALPVSGVRGRGD